MTKLVSISALFVSVVAAADTKKSAEVHVTPSELTWVQPYGPKGPSFAFVAGKFGDKKPASFFIKMKAESDSGWHLHDEEYRAVVIEGTFSEQQQGDTAETKLPAGSYFTQPGKRVHRNGCLQGADCLVYVHFDRGASSTPTTREGKAVK